MQLPSGFGGKFAFSALSAAGICSTKPAQSQGALRIRTSVSGLRHELLLVDFATRTRTVIHVADRIGRETVEDASRLLGMPEIAARDAIDLALVRGRAPALHAADAALAA